MARLSNGSNFADCLTVGQAASFLGVSTATLRNWDRSGKLKPRRHPQNGYRIYLHEDLEAVLRSAELVDADRSAFAPQVDWTDMRESDHFVQFYENDEFLIESVSGFVAAALESRQLQRRHRDAGTSHRAPAKAARLAESDVAAAIEAGRYVVLDAADTLAKFMVDGLTGRRGASRSDWGT